MWLLERFIVNTHPASCTLRSWKELFHTYMLSDHRTILFFRILVAQNHKTSWWCIHSRSQSSE